MTKEQFLKQYNIGEDLKYSGGLYLRGTGITSLPDNLTVGGSLYLRGTGITDTSMINRQNGIISFQDGKYIKCDGIFTEVLKKRGNVYKVKRLNQDKDFYLVTDGNGKYAHGETIKEAKEDLIYKIGDRDKSEYENLNLQDELTFEQAIECYRVITGSCGTGVKDFVENRLKVKKEKYTIAELIEISKGEYQSEVFADFFKR